MLQEAIAAAEGAGDASEEKTELEELKQLLPDIREKVEDAKESQRTASAASQAIQQTLVSTSEQRCLLQCKYPRFKDFLSKKPPKHSLHQCKNFKKYFFSKVTCLFFRVERQPRQHSCVKTAARRHLQPLEQPAR